jgi:uncharacterized membrane protein
MRRTHVLSPSDPAAVRPALRDPVLWLFVVLLGGMLGWLALTRYAGFNAGMYDLGNMAQAIWSGAQGQPLLYSRPEGFNASRLAGHVEAGYLVLAPLYRLWPDPRLLLALQAALFALGAVPVYRIALRRTASPYAARCLALIYLLYPTAQTGVLFDLHADTLAGPLLLFALDAADRRVWRSYALWIALALSFKFYVAGAAFGIGLVLWRWEGQRRAGIATMAAALAYGLLAYFVVRPLFAPHLPGGEVARGYLNYYFGQFDQLAATLGDRLLNVVVVFGPVLLVAWRGWRWLVPALPIALAALLSTGPAGAYDYRYHHYATVVPFIMMAAIDGVARLKEHGARSTEHGAQSTEHGARSTEHGAQAKEDGRPSSVIRRPSSAVFRSRSSRGRSWRGDLGLTLAIVLIFSALLVNTPLNPLFWLRVPGYGFDPSSYGVTERDRVKERFLAEQVPPHEPIAASTFLATRLVNRPTVYLVRYPDEPGPQRLPALLPQVRYAVPDALFDHYVALDEGYGGGLDYDRAAIRVIMRDPSFALTAMRDGLLLFERDAAPGEVLTNTLTLRPDDGAVAEVLFGEQIGLLQAEITQVGPRRLRASFTWRLEQPFDRGERYVAVSRLEGIAQARFVHLPSYALHPAWEWQPGELVEETFDVELSADMMPGSYTWQLGWYDVSHPAAMHTDRRSLMPGSAETAVLIVMVR